jgi:hypothetical protein
MPDQEKQSLSCSYGNEPKLQSCADFFQIIKQRSWPLLQCLLLVLNCTELNSIAISLYDILVLLFVLLGDFRKKLKKSLYQNLLDLLEELVGLKCFS